MTLYAKIWEASLQQHFVETDTSLIAFDRTPFIIYAGSKDPEHVAESQRHGAIGCTNNPNELFEMVLFALSRVANNMS
ncbi:hypothetical protein [Halotia branconii]|uniref:Uncharacterized protein n=1 Tax=Halotia branconii CENA392 TaxID=1539056 RepID=A0AAJ6NQA0_9CYAN|nr:hypothetical protein [Halotia branconii]WGV24561.1 hypothetical protein QI031_22730 [Halotia branconii CENA392]